MAKNAHIGIGGVARRAKMLRLGVNGTARNVRAAYIGVNGVARLWWDGDKNRPPAVFERITVPGQLGSTNLTLVYHRSTGQFVASTQNSATNQGVYVSSAISGGYTWSGVAMPTSGGWGPVTTDGSNLRCFAIYSAVCAVAVNPASWAKSNLLAPQALPDGVTASGGNFCIVVFPRNQNYFYSPGINKQWVTRQLPIGNSMSHATNWGSDVGVGDVSKWVIVGNSGTIAIGSLDALAVPLNNPSPSTTDWSRVIYGNNRYVAVGRDRSTNRGVSGVSLDAGRSWALSSIPLDGVTGIAYGHGRFVVVGKGLAPSYIDNAHSSDGINWYLGTTSIGGASYPPRAVAFGNGHFLVGGAIWARSAGWS